MKYTRTLLLFAAFFLHSMSFATTLNFSSGQYNQLNNLYSESGFTVQASHGFHTVNLGTLAWYEGDNTITIASDSDYFDLVQLTLANTAYSGMIFESSKGGSKSIGAISGIVNFTGDAWQSISYVKIRSLTGTDILNQVDNIVLTPVPEPAAFILMGLGLAAVALICRRSNMKPGDLRTAG